MKKERSFGAENFLQCVGTLSIRHHRLKTFYFKLFWGRNCLGKREVELEDEEKKIIFLSAIKK